VRHRIEQHRAGDYGSGVDTIPVGLAVLRKVVAKFGTVQAAVRLRISPFTLARFLSGRAPVPDIILLRAVELLPDKMQKMQVQVLRPPVDIYTVAELHYTELPPA